MEICTLAISLNMLTHKPTGIKQIHVYYEINRNKEIKNIYDHLFQRIGLKYTDYMITVYKDGKTKVQRKFTGKNWKDVTIEDLIKDIIVENQGMLYYCENVELALPAPNRIPNSRFLLLEESNTVFLFLKPSERNLRIKDLIFDANGDMILSDDEHIWIIDANIVIDDLDITF